MSSSFIVRGEIRDRNAKVHIVLKLIALVVAHLAMRSGKELALKDVSNDRVFDSFALKPRDFALVI